MNEFLHDLERDRAADRAFVWVNVVAWVLTVLAVGLFKLTALNFFGIVAMVVGSFALISTVLSFTQ